MGRGLYGVDGQGRNGSTIGAFLEGSARPLPAPYIGPMTDQKGEWTFVATRPCAACGGTGDAVYEFPVGGIGIEQPSECQTCNAYGVKGRTKGLR